MVLSKNLCKTHLNRFELSMQRESPLRSAKKFVLIVYVLYFIFVVLFYLEYAWPPEQTLLFTFLL